MIKVKRINLYLKGEFKDMKELNNFKKELMLFVSSYSEQVQEPKIYLMYEEPRQKT